MSWIRVGLYGGWALFLVYLAAANARLLAPDLEMLVDIRQVASGEARAFVHFGNGTEYLFQALASDRLVLTLPAFPGKARSTSVQLLLDPTGRRVAEASVDGRVLPEKDFLRVAAFVSSPANFWDYVVLRIPREDSLRWTLTAAFAVVLLGMGALLILALERTRVRGSNPLWAFTYSSDFLRVVRPRDVAWIGAAILISSFFYVGADALGFFNIMRLHGLGVDPYQFQVNHKAFEQFQLLYFPYNPLMTQVWGLVHRLWAPWVAGVPFILDAPLLQILLFKWLNGAAWVLMVLSILSFCAEHGLVKEGDRGAFYFSILNPVPIYVGLLYVHLEPLPLYLMVLGLLFVVRGGSRSILGVVLLAAGCVMKVQGLVLLPPLLLGCLWLELSRRDCRQGWRTSCAQLLAGGTVAVLFGLMHLRHQYGLFHLLKNADQAQRLWFTALTYAPGVVLYLCPFLVAFVFVRAMFQMREGVSQGRVVLHALLTAGAVSLAYNLTQLHTPSTVMQMAVASTAWTVLERDRLKRWILLATSSAILLPYALSGAGDITRILPGYPGYFGRMLAALPEHNQTRWASLFFTLSAGAMLAHIFLFSDAAAKLVSGNETLAEETR